MKNILLFVFIFLLMTINAQQNPAINVEEKLSTIQKEALEFHNNTRKDLGIPPLSWSSEISEYSQEWANYIAKNGCELTHRTPNTQNGKNYGENIGWSSDPSYNLIDASKAWHSEIQFFKNETLNDNNWYKAGHYSQMVWRNTTQMGMGIAKCSNGSIIVVANYNPPGNYMGQKAY
ncbi:CAP family protein [Frigoriflavimonas asaccharolytica]|uniref:Uncharacterized protein YkwD n=1 Tax=Frigoriflavimonas asaccharolytica TaxID=2735899 RepID=A0A8J8G6H4_9FLAO|nr:CAP family protein [Frigoriflavimonas asaccharolytica]NRS92154.1 uncharacterized protein YkwD [Frigoriflavimonas asaccharolytica]